MVKLNLGEKKVLKILSNKRGQSPKTIENKLDQYPHLLYPSLNSLVEKKLIQRKQILKKATPKRRAKRVTKYYITEKGLRYKT